MSIPKRTFSTQPLHKTQTKKETTKYRIKTIKKVAQNTLNTKVKNTNWLPQKISKTIQPSFRTTAQEDRRKLENQQQQKIKPKYNVPYVALEHLKDQLKNKMMSDEFATFNRLRILSIFHNLPVVTPHSKRQLSLSEKQKKMTTSYSNTIAIIKGDDGRCILRQDLSNVGMDGVIALSGFSCGQTKMEKMYDKYMDKVLKKLGKK